MIKIRLLKDWQTKKAGEIINISEKGAKQFVEVGAAEYIKEENSIPENEVPQETYNPEREIKKLCLKRDIVICDKDDIKKMCGIGLGGIFENELNNFSETKSGNYVLTIKNPYTKAEYFIEISYRNPVASEVENILKKETDKMTLGQIHEIYKRLLYIEDTDRLDIVFATYLSSKLDGIPIWIIIVGASGDMKSVQINALEDEEVNTYLLHNLTSKSLVNGFKDKSKYPDLAPKLNGKVVLIPDMAQILKLPPNEKAELWGQLRDLYDGYAGKESGQGSSQKYSGLKATLIAGSTPAIDGQVLVHQDLGTRELIYRTSGNKNKEKVMQKCFENENSESDIKNELKNATQKFLEGIKLKNIEPSKNVLYEIKKIALYTSFLRAGAEFDQYTNELRNDVYPEEPTRIAKQLKRLYTCLKNLDESYPDEKAVNILWHIGKSSAFPLRVKVLEFLKSKCKPDGFGNVSEFSTSQIAEYLCLGKSTIKRECAVLENLKIISCNRKETSYPDKFYEYWKLNVNPSIKTLQDNKDNNTYIIFMDAFGLIDKEDNQDTLNFSLQDLDKQVQGVLQNE